MTPEAFREAVDAALAEVPEEFRKRLAEVAVQVKARPSPAELRAARVKRGRVVFGLYQGTPRPERTGYDLPRLPDRIVLYQDTLERYFPDPAELAAEIRKTVLHEIGHHFGLSERRLQRLGYG